MSVMSFSHTVATTASLSLLLFSSPIAAQPSQIHLAITEEPSTSMSVQFSAPVTTQSEQVIQYGNSADDLAFVETTASYNFTDGGSEHYEQTFHIGEMKHLKPHTRNYYRVGSDGGGWSDVYDFVTAPVNGDTSAFPLRFGIWGDMGHTNSQILMSVKEEVENNNFDMILHVGDFAYDMHDDNGHNGDAFMNDIQPMAARVPYMVSQRPQLFSALLFILTCVDANSDADAHRSIWVTTSTHMNGLITRRDSEICHTPMILS